MNKIKQGLLSQQPQLSQLLVSNKTLAVQKREFHRQKLRAYSQKAVKLRSILRQTTDGEEKRCLQQKLKALQEKQDAEITKLAKIDQIQKQIDQFITQENEDPHVPIISTQAKSNKNQIWRSQVQGTPADRLRTKSSLPMKNYNNSNNQKQLDFSRKRSIASKKQESQQLLLKDSRQALQELINNQSNYGQKRQNSKKSFKLKEVMQPFSSYKKAEDAPFQSSQNLQETKPFWKQQQVKSQKSISYDSVPPVFLTFVDKVGQFWPKDLEQLIKYFKESEFNRKKLTQKQKQFDLLVIRQQKVRKDQQKVKKDQDRLKRTQQKLRNQEEKSKGLIADQRRLMQKIDKLQKEHEAVKKQIDSSFSSIAKSAELISSSSFMLNQQKDPIQINCLYADQVHKFSVDSFESASEGSLYYELSKFQKGIQQYLLSAERTVMIISGQIQQNASKLAKFKEQSANLESKKKSLETEISKTEQSLVGKKNLLRQMEAGLKKLQFSIKQNNDTLQLKRALCQELEEKCDKLKNKKRPLGQKVKKLEQEVQSLTLKKQQLFQMIFEVEHRLNAMKILQKQLDGKIIFCEREKDNRLKDLHQLQKKQQQLINRLQQTNQGNQEISLKGKEKQKQLNQLQELILKRRQQELELGERAQKTQQQLAQATSFVQQQNKFAQKQMQEIAQKSAEHLSIQAQIAQVLALLHQHQKQNFQLQQQIKAQTELLTKDKEEIANISKVKQDLQNILHEIMQKKQQLLFQVQDRTKQLQSLLRDMQSAKQDYRRMLQTTQQYQLDLKGKEADIKSIQSQLEDIRNELDSELEQQSNILRRIARLKEFQSTMLLEIGAKGTSHLLQEELKARVNQAVAQLANLNEIKSQLKQCKYENRKLKLDNQRLSKLLSQPQLMA